MPKTQDYFAGKTIIITGAASGIGRAAALIFAREKANVVCADIDEDGLAKTAETINAIGSQALALTIDVTRRAAVENMPPIVGIWTSMNARSTPSSRALRHSRPSNACTMLVE